MNNIKIGDKVVRKNDKSKIGKVMEVNYLDLEDVYIICFEDGHATLHGIDLYKI